jgi:hypothetical protein
MEPKDKQGVRLDWPTAKERGGMQEFLTAYPMPAYVEPTQRRLWLPGAMLMEDFDEEALPAAAAVRRSLRGIMAACFDGYEAEGWDSATASNWDFMVALMSFDIDDNTQDPTELLLQEWKDWYMREIETQVLDLAPEGKEYTVRAALAQYYKVMKHIDEPPEELGDEHPTLAGRPQEDESDEARNEWDPDNLQEDSEIEDEGDLDEGQNDDSQDRDYVKTGEDGGVGDEAEIEEENPFTDMEDYAVIPGESRAERDERRAKEKAADKKAKKTAQAAKKAKKREATEDLNDPLVTEEQIVAMMAKYRMPDPPFTTTIQSVANQTVAVARAIRMLGADSPAEKAVMRYIRTFYQTATKHRAATRKVKSLAQQPMIRKARSAVQKARQLAQDREDWSNALPPRALLVVSTLLSRDFSINASISGGLMILEKIDMINPASLGKDFATQTSGVLGLTAATGGPSQVNQRQFIAMLKQQQTLLAELVRPDIRQAAREIRGKLKTDVAGFRDECQEAFNAVDVTIQAMEARIAVLEGRQNLEERVAALEQQSKPARKDWLDSDDEEDPVPLPALPAYPTGARGGANEEDSLDEIPDVPPGKGKGRMAAVLRQKLAPSTLGAKHRSSPTFKGATLTVSRGQGVHQSSPTVKPRGLPSRPLRETPKRQREGGEEGSGKRARKG